MLVTCIIVNKTRTPGNEEKAHQTKKQRKKSSEEDVTTQNPSDPSLESSSSHYVAAVAARKSKLLSYNPLFVFVFEPAAPPLLFPVKLLTASAAALAAVLA